jgi:hypothetical protein
MSLFWFRPLLSGRRGVKPIRHRHAMPPFPLGKEDRRVVFVTLSLRRVHEKNLSLWILREAQNDLSKTLPNFVTVSFPTVEGVPK